MDEVAYAGGDPVRTFLPPEYWSRARDFFSYNLQWEPLAAGAVGQADDFTVDASSDFLALGVVFVYSQTDNTTVVPFAPVEITVRDSASGGLWSDNPFHLHNFAGQMTADATGFLRFVQPRFCSGSTQVTVEATNLDGANARNLWLSFHGVKIYRGISRAR